MKDEMRNPVQRLVMRLFGKKEELKPEKVRVTVKNGRIVKVYYPACIVGDHAKHSIFWQQLSDYEIKLNGNPLNND